MDGLQEFVLTEDQMTKLKEAGIPSARENRDGTHTVTERELERTRLRVNDAWREVGIEAGFDWRTVRPHPSGDEYRFLAEPMEPETPEAA